MVHGGGGEIFRGPWERGISHGDGETKVLLLTKTLASDTSFSGFHFKEEKHRIESNFLYIPSGRGELAVWPSGDRRIALKKYQNEDSYLSKVRISQIYRAAIRTVPDRAGTDRNGPSRAGSWYNDVFNAVLIRSLISWMLQYSVETRIDPSLLLTPLPQPNDR